MEVEKPFKRPKKIHVFFVDGFTKEEAHILTFPYNPILMLKAIPRKYIIASKKMYHKERILPEHDPLRFSGATLYTRIQYEY